MSRHTQKYLEHNEVMKTWNQRLVEAMKSKGVIAHDLAKGVGAAPSTVAQWMGTIEGKKPTIRLSEENTTRICDFLGVNREWLFKGIGSMSAHGAIDPLASNVVSIASAQFPKRPLLNTVSAGGFREAIDNIHPDEAEWIAPHCVRGSELSAWLVIQNDSMEPQFREGDRILVDPEAQWDHGSFVVAANGDGHWTFKQLVRDGADWFLKPLNDKYPTKKIDSGVTIIGKATEHQPKSHKL